MYGQKRVEGGVGQSREPKLSVCCLHTSAHPFLAKNRPGAPVFGHCPLFFLYVCMLVDSSSVRKRVEKTCRMLASTRPGDPHGTPYGNNARYA